MKYKIILIVLVSLLSGCITTTTISQESIIKLYEKERMLPKKYPVIFIHGIMGSILEDSETGKVIWGDVAKGFLDELALPIDNDNLKENKDSLFAAAPLEKISWIPGFIEKDIYAGAYNVAIKGGGYTFGKDAFTLAYDWRRDLVESAQQLGKLIEKIKSDLGQPDLRVNLLCHSAGGLVARYYAKYGAEDVLDKDPIPEPTYSGAKNINKIIMMGTPNRGSVESFERLHNGYWLPTIGLMTVETLFTMPSAYELLPFDSNDMFIDVSGNKMNLDIYNVDNWEKYGWSVFNYKHQTFQKFKYVSSYGKEEGGEKFNNHVETQKKYLKCVLLRAEKFHEALCKGDPDEERSYITYVIFGSDTKPTLQRVLVKQNKMGWDLHFYSKDKSIKEKLDTFGDGSVTRQSLLGLQYDEINGQYKEQYRVPASYEMFFPEGHVDMPNNPTFLDNILHVLLDDKNNESSLWERLISKIKDRKSHSNM